MIYTIALNPAIDRTFWVDRIDFDDANRVESERRYPGGKGIDVSRVLTKLGLPNRALGFIGGYAGDELECRLISEGVDSDFVRISGETRTNIVLHESCTGRQILLTTSGPEISPYELGRLLKQVESLKDPTIVAMGGSLPPGVHPEIYRRMITLLRKKGILTILDADGEALRVGIQGNPDYIKPNIHELGRLVRRELTNIEEVMESAEEVRRLGVGTVLVSWGAKGMVLVGEEGSYLAVPPKVEAVNTVGVGDSAVAGFIYGLTIGLDLKGCLTFATAAGTATVLKPGTARAGREDVLAMVPRIGLKEISRSGR
jgi:6-phosphofructokinase 2